MGKLYSMWIIQPRSIESKHDFSSSHVQIWELDHKEDWVLKNWCFITVVLEKTLESPLDSKEIKPINPKGNQPWLSIERTEAEAEAPITELPDAKNQLTGKDPNTEKDWGQEKGMTEDDKIRWHHRLNGHEFEQTPMRQWRTGKSGVLQSIGSQSQTQLKWPNNNKTVIKK